VTIRLGESRYRQDENQKKEEPYFSEFLAQDTVPLFSATDYLKFNPVKSSDFCLLSKTLKFRGFKISAHLKRLSTEPSFLIAEISPKSK
jgi:hypothetical protein